MRSWAELEPERPVQAQPDCPPYCGINVLEEDVSENPEFYPMV